MRLKSNPHVSIVSLIVGYLLFIQSPPVTVAQTLSLPSGFTLLYRVTYSTVVPVVAQQAHDEMEIKMYQALGKESPDKQKVADMMIPQYEKNLQDASSSQAVNVEIMSISCRDNKLLYNCRVISGNENNSATVVTDGADTWVFHSLSDELEIVDGLSMGDFHDLVFPGINFPLIQFYKADAPVNFVSSAATVRSDIWSVPNMTLLRYFPGSVTLGERNGIPYLERTSLDISDTHVAWTFSQPVPLLGTWIASSIHMSLVSKTGYKDTGDYQLLQATPTPLPAGDFDLVSQLQNGYAVKADGVTFFYNNDNGTLDQQIAKAGGNFGPMSSPLNPYPCSSLEGRALSYRKGFSND